MVGQPSLGDIDKQTAVRSTKLDLGHEEAHSPTREFEAVQTQLNCLSVFSHAGDNDAKPPAPAACSALSLPTEVWSTVLELMQPELVGDDGRILWGEIWRDTGILWSNTNCLPRSKPALSFDPGLQTIRSLRLVCRHFNTLASPYMCPILNISLKPSSIRHAERLCENPLIVNGIICVQIWLQSYSKELAERLDLWAHTRELEFLRITPGPQADHETNVHLWWRELANDLPSPLPSESDIARLARRRLGTRRILHHLATRAPVHEDSESDRDKKLRLMCEEAWGGYRKAWEEQQKLIKDGSFANRVATLLTQMQKPLALGLRTGNDWDGWPRARDMMLSGSSFQDALQRPHCWTRLDKSGGSYNFDVARLLFQIPVACHRAGVVIRSFTAGHVTTTQAMPHMTLDGTDDNDPLRCTEYELYAAFSRLEEVRIESKQRDGFPRECLTTHEPIVYGGSRETSIDRLYRAMLSSPCLTHVFGSFVVWGNIHLHYIRRATLQQYPFMLAMPATGRLGSGLRRLYLDGIIVSQQDLLRCLWSLCADTENVHLNELQVTEPEWEVIWDVMREQLKGVKMCQVWMNGLRDATTRDYVDYDVIKQASLYVTGYLDHNPGGPTHQNM